MSTIFNYSTPGAAENYDEKRVAVGVDIIAGMIQIYCGKPMKVSLSDLRVVTVCSESFVFSFLFVFDEVLT